MSMEGMSESSMKLEMDKNMKAGGKMSGMDHGHEHAGHDAVRRRSEDARDAGWRKQTGFDVTALRDPTHVVHSGGAFVVLLVATVLGVYKPRGITPYGQRKQRE